MKISIEEAGDLLLWPLWRCIKEEYKDVYKASIWDHFESAIRSAAYTDSLKDFLTNFQRKIPIALEQQYANDIMSAVNCENEMEVLSWFRLRTTYLAVYIRVRNQERKELFK